MDSKVRLHKICCPTHSDDIVIRVSLDPKQEKLFYCHECLTDYKGPELVKFQDILKALEIQYHNSSLEGVQVALPDEMKTFLDNQEDMQRDLSDQIAEERQKVYEEAKKMEVQMSELFNNVRTAIHAHFDSYGANFRKAFDEFEQSVILLKQSGGTIPKGQAEPKAMHERIFASSNINEVENNLRAILKEINMYKEINRARGVDQIIARKSILEEGFKNSSLVESKGLKYYAERLSIYQNYLEAVLVGFKKYRENENARDKDCDFKFEQVWAIIIAKI